MNDKDVLKEVKCTETIDTRNIDEYTKESVSVEQNINIVNIDMGKRPLLEKLDYDAISEWISNHVIHLAIGFVLLVYTIVLLIMATVLIREKKTINDLMTGSETMIITEQPETITLNETYIDDDRETAEHSYSAEKEDIASSDELARQEEVEADEPVTEVDLYDCSLVGETYSEKRYSATNTVGEELEKIFFLSGGMYTETVGFYLNGKYDRLTANISCDESTKNTSFDVNIYLDDGPCVKKIHVEKLMAKVPIDIDTTGAMFIKFDITGSFYNHGAILSDGMLHVADIENKTENQDESDNK